MLYYFKMMKLVCIKLFILYLCTVNILAATTLYLNPMRSAVGFKTHLLGVKEINAKFLASTVIIDLKDTSTIQQFEMKIDTASLSTGTKYFDRHLKEKKFFNSVINPYIMFVATGPINIKSKVLNGELLINGVRKKVQLPVQFNYIKKESDLKYKLHVRSNGFIIDNDLYNLNWFPFFTSHLELYLNLVTETLNQRN